MRTDGENRVEMKLIEPGVNKKRDRSKVMRIVAYLLAIMMVSLPAPSLGAAVGFFADGLKGADHACFLESGSGFYGSARRARHPRLAH